MLQLSIMDQSGHSDVSVYTYKSISTYPWQDWLDPKLTRTDRNVASFPIRITNPDPVEYLGPLLADDDGKSEVEKRFVNAALPAVWFLKGMLRIDVLRGDDSIIKSKVSNPSFPLLRDGRARILPGETIQTNLSFSHAWFDKTGGAIPTGELVYLFIQFDPAGQLQTKDGETAQCNIYGVPARFYVGQVRHSGEVNIP